jgi:hypothetical protein
VFIQPKLAGDFALIKAMAKRLVERDDEALAAGRPACSTATSSPGTPAASKL